MSYILNMILTIRFFTFIILFISPFFLIKSSEHQHQELKIGIQQFPDQLNPLFNLTHAKSFLLGFIQRPLTSHDSSGTVACYLCANIPTLDNQGATIIPHDDGTETIRITFKLRGNLFWGDGVPVTSRDVLFTWSLVKNKNILLNTNSDYQKIQDIVIIDDRNFTIETKNLDFQYNLLPEFFIVPYHIENKIVEQSLDSMDYVNKSTYTRNPTNPGLWLGPYLVSDYTEKKAVTLSLNPFWHGKEPSFTTITINLFENSAKLQAALLINEVDYIPGEIGLSFREGMDLQAKRSQSYHYVFKNNLSYELILPNHANPALADARVRHALLSALDREKEIKVLFNGNIDRATGIIAPEDPAFDPSLVPEPFDPQKAARLLFEAGFFPGRDGIGVRADGVALRFSLVTTTGNPIRSALAQDMKNQWRAVGIDLVIREESVSTLAAKTLPEGRYDLALVGWTYLPERPPADAYGTIYIPKQENGYTGSNYARINDQYLENLFKKINMELNYNKRKEYWKEFQIYYQEKLPMIPLYFTKSTFIIPLWLDGINPSSSSVSSSLWIENWYAN